MPLLRHGPVSRPPHALAEAARSGALGGVGRGGRPTFQLSHFPTFRPSNLPTFPLSHLPTFPPFPPFTHKAAGCRFYAKAPFLVRRMRLLKRRAPGASAELAGEGDPLSYLPTFPPSYLPTFPPSYLPTFPPSYLPTSPPFTHKAAGCRFYAMAPFLVRRMRLLKRRAPGPSDRVGRGGRPTFPPFHIPTIYPQSGRMPLLRHGPVSRPPHALAEAARSGGLGGVGRGGRPTFQLSHFPTFRPSHPPTFPPSQPSYLPTFPPSYLPTFPPSHLPTFPPPNLLRTKRQDAASTPWPRFSSAACAC
jgi:hypothetical protein